MKRKRPAKENNPTPEYDSERETRVLLEQVRSDVKVVAEGHGLVVNRLDNVDRRFDNVESELTTVKTAVLENSKGIKILKQGQNEIKQRLDLGLSNHEKRINTLEEKTHIT